MLHCPNCNSTNYHVMFGYGAYCEDCSFAKDGEGETVGDSNDENDDIAIVNRPIGGKENVDTKR